MSPRYLTDVASRIVVSIQVKAGTEIACLENTTTLDFEGEIDNPTVLQKVQVLVMRACSWFAEGANRAMSSAYIKTGTTLPLNRPGPWPGQESLEAVKKESKQGWAQWTSLLDTC